MRAILAALGFVLLVGCSAFNVSDMSAAELQKLPIPTLCAPWASGQTVEAERSQRGLSDCTLADQQCVIAGYRAGTSAYNDCRYGSPQQQAAVAQNQCAMSVANYCSAGIVGEMARARTSACMQEGYVVASQQLQCAVPRVPTQTICQPFGTGVICNTP